MRGDFESPIEDASFSSQIGGLMTVPQLICELAFDLTDGLLFKLDLDLDLDAC